jgi:hypothetical protein
MPPIGEPPLQENRKKQGKVLLGMRAYSMQATLHAMMPVYP